MLDDTHVQPFASQPEPIDDDGTAQEHGRVGYGRIGRFSPLILGALLLAVVGAIWWVQRDSVPSGAEVGSLTNQPAPDVTLTLMDGSPLRLADLRGKVVVLNFWASWCAPCRREMPELQAFWNEIKQSDEPTAIVGVGVRTDHDQDARALVAQGGFDYPIGRDTNTELPGLGPIETAFGVPEGYPATVVIRPDGVVDRYVLGPVNPDTLRSLINSARQASS
jgi:cytochrome c biogenesis protein CcmG/thiol:disulfide interchange protein DsbE